MQHYHAEWSIIRLSSSFPLSTHSFLSLSFFQPFSLLCSIVLFGCSAQPSGMLCLFDQVFIISVACLSVAGFLRENHGLHVQEASPRKTEKSPGIPPPLMRSIPIHRSPQAASTRWNAWPLSLIALLRAISNSLSA